VQNFEAIQEDSMKEEMKYYTPPKRVEILTIKNAEESLAFNTIHIYLHTPTHFVKIIYSFMLENCQVK
jgi:hypothetical protein